MFLSESEEKEKNSILIPNNLENTTSNTKKRKKEELNTQKDLNSKKIHTEQPDQQEDTPKRSARSQKLKKILRESMETSKKLEKVNPQQKILDSFPNIENNESSIRTNNEPKLNHIELNEKEENLQKEKQFLLKISELEKTVETMKKEQENSQITEKVLSLKIEQKEKLLLSMSQTMKQEQEIYQQNEKKNSLKINDLEKQISSSEIFHSSTLTQKDEQIKILNATIEDLQLKFSEKVKENKIFDEKEKSLQLKIETLEKQFSESLSKEESEKNSRIKFFNLELEINKEKLKNSSSSLMKLETELKEKEKNHTESFEELKKHFEEKEKNFQSKITQMESELAQKKEKEQSDKEIIHNSKILQLEKDLVEKEKYFSDLIENLKKEKEAEISKLKEDFSEKEKLVFPSNFLKQKEELKNQFSMEIKEFRQKEKQHLNQLEDLKKDVQESLQREEDLKNKIKTLEKHFPPSSGSANENNEEYVNLLEEEINSLIEMLDDNKKEYTLMELDLETKILNLEKENLELRREMQKEDENLQTKLKRLEERFKNNGSSDKSKKTN